MTWKPRRLSLPTLLLVVSAAACVGSAENTDSASPTPGSPASPSPSPSNSEVKVEGAIAGLAGTCPNLSFTINGQRVLTSSGTQFEHAACGDLRSGMQVEVEGARQADGAILARKADRKDVQQQQPQEADLQGTVAALTGTCPNLSFTINGQRVLTNSGTQFEHAACGDLRSGMQVEAEGTRQADGAILARKVERQDAEQQAQEVELKGAVAGLGGACPNLSFSINGQRVVTDASTRFDKLSCSDVRNAMQVEAKGVRQSDGSVRATRLKRED